MLFDHSSGRSDTAWKFVTWLTSAKVHLQFAIATGDLPLRKSETQLPGYATFLQKYPAEKVFVEQSRQRQARPAEPAGVRAGVDRRSGRWCSRSCSGPRQPADALKSGASAVTAALAGS